MRGHIDPAQDLLLQVEKMLEQSSADYLVEAANINEAANNLIRNCGGQIRSNSWLLNLALYTNEFDRRYANLFKAKWEQA